MVTEVKQLYGPEVAKILEGCLRLEKQGRITVSAIIKTDIIQAQVLKIISTKKFKDEFLGCMDFRFRARAISDFEKNNDKRIK